MFLMLLILIVAFSIYMWFTDGYIYVASDHFEKEFSVKKIKEKMEKKHVCKSCGTPIAETETYCENCKRKQLANYSSSNDFGNLK